MGNPLRGSKRGSSDGQNELWEPAILAGTCFSDKLRYVDGKRGIRCPRARGLIRISQLTHPNFNAAIGKVQSARKSNSDTSAIGGSAKVRATAPVIRNRTKPNIAKGRVSRLLH